MTRMLPIAILTLLWTVNGHAAQQNDFDTIPGHTSVFITSIGAVDGYTDPSQDNRDTVRDLWEAMKRHQRLRRAEDRDTAKVVLVVLGRETAQMTAGAFGTTARDRIIRVKMIVNGTELQTELTASAQGGTMGSGGAWSKAASKVMQQVDTWVFTNRSKL